MSFDINLICRELGDGSASTNVKNGELTWAELDSNFIALKAALKLAVSMIPADLSLKGIGSNSLFERFNCAYSHGNAAGLTKNNELIMWGSNRGYALAASNVIASTATPPTSIKFPRPPKSYGTIVDFGTTGGLSYALFDDGSLYTWGINTYGQLGTGDTVNRSHPTLIADDVDVVYPQINAGYHVEYGQLFVRRKDGYLYGCGYNGNGKLGLGTTKNVSTLTKIAGAGTGFKKVWNLGRNAGCLIVQKSDSTIWACGYNGRGQLGNGATANVLALIDITSYWGGADPSDNIEFQGGFSYDDGNQCSLILAKNYIAGGFQVWSCGSNDWGQLGDGTVVDRKVPVNVINNSAGAIKKIMSFGGAPLTTYVLLEDGTLYNWGYNGLGQIGNGTKKVKSTIGATFKINGQKAVDMWSSSDSHTNGHYASVFIKMENGVIYATGYNAHGQLACGDNTEHLSFVQSLFGTHDITDIQGISVSDSRAFVATTSEGKALVWGYGGSYDLGTALPSLHNAMPKEISWI